MRVQRRPQGLTFAHPFWQSFARPCISGLLLVEKYACLCLHTCVKGMIIMMVTVGFRDSNYVPCILMAKVNRPHDLLHVLVVKACGGIAASCSCPVSPRHLPVAISWAPDPIAYHGPGYRFLVALLARLPYMDVFTKSNPAPSCQPSTKASAAAWWMQCDSNPWVSSQKSIELGLCLSNLNGAPQTLAFEL